MEEILVVDDEQSVVEVVSLYLKRDGYRVRQALDGSSALQQVRESKPDLIILDLMLPKVDGMEVLRRVREDLQYDIPIIMLTARGQELDRVYGLEMGADDYVTKPFSPVELIARVKAVLRRSGGGAKSEGEKAVRMADLVIDPTSRTVTAYGESKELTATEFNLLQFMATRPNQVFSRKQLLEHVWGFSDFVDPSTVTVHIRRLREKIEQDPSNPRWLQTVWGVGYKFEPGDK